MRNRKVKMPARKLLKLNGTPQSLATAWGLIVDLHSEFIDFCPFIFPVFPLPAATSAICQN